MRIDPVQLVNFIKEIKRNVTSITIDYILLYTILYINITIVLTDFTSTLTYG